MHDHNRFLGVRPRKPRAKTAPLPSTPSRIDCNHSCPFILMQLCNATMQCNKRPVRLQATCRQASLLFCCNSSRVLIMQGNSQVVFSVQTVPRWISWHNLYEPTNRSLFFHSRRFYSYFSGEYLVSQFSITFPEKISNKKSPLDFQRFSKRMHAWQFKYGVS